MGVAAASLSNKSPLKFFSHPLIGCARRPMLTWARRIFSAYPRQLSLATHCSTQLVAITLFFAIEKLNVLFHTRKMRCNGYKDCKRLQINWKLVWFVKMHMFSPFFSRRKIDRPVVAPSLSERLWSGQSCNSSILNYIFLCCSRFYLDDLLVTQLLRITSNGYCGLLATLIVHVWVHRS